MYDLRSAVFLSPNMVQWEGAASGTPSRREYAFFAIDEKCPSVMMQSYYFLFIYFFFLIFIFFMALNASSQFSSIELLDLGHMINQLPYSGNLKFCWGALTLLHHYHRLFTTSSSSEDYFLFHLNVWSERYVYFSRTLAVF